MLEWDLRGQRLPQDPCDGVVDTYYTVIAGNCNPVTEGRHARKVALDGSYGGSPGIRATVKLDD